MKIVLSLTLTLALLPPFGTSAQAQGVEDYTPSPVVYEEYPYSIRKDGALIYEGDLVYACEDLPRLIGDPKLPSARRALEACVELGHLPPTDDELPDTGGMPPTGPIVALASVAGLVLAIIKFRQAG